MPEIIQNNEDGWFAFPTINRGINRDIPLLLKKWTMTDFGIRITLSTNFEDLIRRYRYKITIGKQYFSGMKIYYSNYSEEENELKIALETNDAGLCDQLDEKIGSRIGCLVVLNVM